ncbi:sensor histidine kinase [Afifella pfennigii]|uniref:sensor histidine kinase n=1 Tax=Afifella pfennigii TaxID=209897 RepID=UPI00068A562A|nr:cache domain-containing protein [Afifella pfennigii]
MVSIRSVLALSLAGLQLVAIAAVILPFYFTSERVLLDHARALVRDVARNTTSHAVGFLAPAEDAADLSQRLARQQVVSSENEDAMERYFFEQLRSHEQFAGIFYGNTEGDFVYVNRDDSVAGADFRVKTIENRPLRRQVELIWRDATYVQRARRSDPEDQYDPRTRPWYAAAVEANGVAWTDPYIFFSSREPGITVATPVRAPGGTLTGVVGIDIEISALSGFLAGLKVGETGGAFIVSDSGDVIAYRDPAKIKTEGEAGETLRFTRIDELDDPLAQAAAGSFRSRGQSGGQTRDQGADQDGGTLPEASETSSSFRFSGETFHAVASALPGTRWPWTVITYVPENDFLGAIKESRRNGYLLALGVAILTGLLGLLIARTITRPIGQLYRQAEDIAAGSLKPMPPLKTRYNELHRTGLAFSRMTDWLRREKDANETLTADLRAASRQLEARVEQRTAELNDANSKLREEAELRAAQAERLQKANEQAELLARELNHRVKNVFAVVAAILSLGARSATSADELAKTTRRRIDALSKAHSVTQGYGAATAVGDLGRLARLVLAPYMREEANQVTISGESARIDSEAATGLGLILHELATNAAKYGALSVPEGKVELSWQVEEAKEPKLTITWRESNGPPPSEPEADKRGFGTQMVEQIVAQYRASYRIDWLKEGLVATLTMPLPKESASHAAA